MTGVIGGEGHSYSRDNLIGQKSVQDESSIFFPRRDKVLNDLIEITDLSCRGATA